MQEALKLLKEIEIEEKRLLNERISKKNKNEKLGFLFLKYLTKNFVVKKFIICNFLRK